MKILIVAPFFPPANSIGALRPYSWAKYWSMNGCDVTVITTKQYNDKWNTLMLDCSGFNIVSLDNSTRKLQYIKDFTKKVFGKPINHLFPIVPSILDVWLLKAYFATRKTVWDVVISTYSPASALLLGYFLKRRNCTKKFVIDYRDLWAYNPVEFKSRFTRRIEYLIESRIVRLADEIITVSKPLSDDLKRYFNLSNVHVITNGIDFDDLKCLESDPCWNDGKFRVLYSGTIYKKSRDPTPFFLALSDLINSGVIRKDNFEVVFVGNNSYVINEIIPDKNLSSFIKCLGLVDRNTSLKMQRDASALLFLENDKPEMSGYLTGKIFEYLASGTPIIGVGVSSLSPVGKLIEDSECGRALGVEVDKIKEYLNYLLQTKNYQVKNNFVQKFDRKNLAGMLLEIISK